VVKVPGLKRAVKEEIVGEDIKNESHNEQINNKR